MNTKIYVFDIWLCYIFPFLQDIVCEICGNGSRPDLIANCARCNTYEHWYSFISLPYLVFSPLYFQILSSWKIYLYNWPSALHMCVFMLINCLTYFYIMMSWEQELAREVDDSWISVMIWNQYGFRIDMCMNYAWNFLSYFIMCYFYLIYSGNKVILKWMCNFFLFSSLRVLSFSIRSYCMQVVTYVIPHEWYCAGCQEYANGCPKPSQSI